MLRRSSRLCRGLPTAIAACAAVMAVAAAPAYASSFLYVGEGHALVWRDGGSDPPAGWNGPDHVPDGSWRAGPDGFGLGYGDGDDRTVVAGMEGAYVTVYARATFRVGDEAGRLTFLELTARYDDGFVAYLNGVEIGRANLPPGAVSRTTEASGHEASDGDAAFAIDPSLLRPGENVFAVEVHNTSPGSSDLSFTPTLWGYDVPPIDAEIVLGPVVQLVGRRGATVCWETDVPSPARLAVGVGEGETPRLLESPAPARRHEVRVEGLRPGSVVHYRVESARWPSPVGAIRTEGDRADPFRVVVFGDTRSNHDAHAEVIERIVAAAPRLVVHTGDLVGDGETPSDWATFFEIEAALLRDVPLYPAIGNHEGDAEALLEHFALPDGSAGAERYYVTRHATAAFVVIDQYQSDLDAGSAQREWLEETLGNLAVDPTVLHVFVALHHGPYDSGPHGSHMTTRDELVPLLLDAGVSIVFSGHDHTYERSNVDGIRYVVTGGGGAPLYDAEGDWWTVVTEATHHYCVLDVDGPRVHFEARRLDGSLLDTFDLGAAADECSGPDDCAGPGLACEPDERGEWRCVHGACVWNCSLLSGSTDGDADADGDADGDSSADGGGDADTDTDVADGEDGGSGTPGSGLGGGCGCAAARGAHGAGGPFRRLWF